MNAGGGMESSLPFAAPLLAELTVVWVLAIPAVVLAAAAFGVVAVAFHFLLGAPAARIERARFFLHLLECGVNQGKSPEQTVAELARSRTLELGARFHLVAAHLGSGLKLSEALSRVPRFLPPSICAMLRVGEELGDIRKVVPACRTLVRRQSWSGRSNIVASLMMLTLLLPLVTYVLVMFSVFLAPRLNEIFYGLDRWAGSGSLDGWPLWAGLRVAMPWILIGLGVLWLVVGTVTVASLAGPRVRGWFGGDRLTWLFPWVRMRCHRDFAAMLAVLLDAGVPETRALALAAATTGREDFVRRVEAAGAAVSNGAGFAQAIERIEGRGEFTWRLTNSLRSGGRFLDAVTGWLAALELKAERSEQTASQTLFVTTVLLQGLLVGLVTVAVFGLLSGLIESLL